MLQIHQFKSNLYSSFTNYQSGTRKFKEERDILPPIQEPAVILQRQHALQHNRSAGIYSLNQIRNKMVEATSSVQEMKLSSTATEKNNLTSTFNTTSVSDSTIQPVGETANTTSVINVDNIVLSDGSSTYSLGKNVDIRISDGDLVINNSNHYRFDQSSNFRIYQVLNSNNSQQQNDLLTITNGVATVNHAANFDVYEDGVAGNPGGGYLQFQIIDGNIPGQSSVPNSLFFGNGTNASPVGTLRTQGADYMVTSTDHSQMVFSLQDDQGEYFIWQVQGDPNKIKASFDEIHSRVQNENLNYDQLQDITRSHGL